MLSLTDEQIAFIEKDIKIRGITSPDLSIDLLDHICCLIENELDEYRNFESVYQNVLSRFGEKGLKEIQLETNRLLTFKHYYIMNSTMKISGYISSLMILSGAIFKFNHWPGAGVLMVSGVFFFTVLFLPLLFILKFKSSAESNRSILLSIIGFVSALAISSGVLFRIMHWPGARMITITGCALLVLAYLPVYLLSIYKNTTNKINAAATIIIIIAGTGLFITESGTGIPRPTSDSFWRGITESNDLLNFTTNETEIRYLKLETLLASDSSKTKAEQVHQLKAATADLMNYTQKMKTFLISTTEEISEAEAAKINLDVLRTGGDGAGDLQRILFGEIPSEYGAIQLKTKIDNYRELVSKIAPTTDVKNISTEKLLVYGEEVSWEQSNFDQLPIPIVVFNLIRIELGIKATETAALNQL